MRPRTPGSGAPVGARDVHRLARRLAEIHAQRRAREPEPEPGADLAELAATSSRYDAARRLLEARERRMDERERWAEAIAGEVLPPLGDGHGEVEETLRALQRQVLRHPTAFRAGFAALIAEGRRFARTPEGAEWHAKLRQSPLLAQARLLLKMVSLSLLDEQEPEVLPSGYVEALLRAAVSEDGDAILNRLFGGSTDDR